MPFLALRSYLPADHPDKHREIGSEATPGAFIDTLLELTEEFARVLTPHGSLCLELGDTYSGSGGAGGDYGPVGMREGQPEFDGAAARMRTPGGDDRGSRRLNLGDGPPRRTVTDAWPEAKSLCLIPELYRISLVYGRNPLTGRETPRWRARNVVRWCRPNPPVGALGDKFRPATSEMVVACKSAKRWFDLDAVREPAKYPDDVRAEGSAGYRGITEGGARSLHLPSHPAGAPPLDWWNIPTQPYSGSHYATWPERLCVRPILSMCPQRVCRVCGEPSRRIVGDAEYVQSRNGGAPAVLDYREGVDIGGGVRAPATHGMGDSSVTRVAPTLGWTDCGHDDWRAGVTLDPFAGSGTTLAVASGHGRDCIGIDLDARNAELALERVGPLLLTVEHFAKENVA